MTPCFYTSRLLASSTWAIPRSDPKKWREKNYFLLVWFLTHQCLDIFLKKITKRWCKCALLWSQVYFLQRTEWFSKLFIIPGFVLFKVYSVLYMPNAKQYVLCVYTVPMYIISIKTFILFLLTSPDYTMHCHEQIEIFV